MCVCVISANRKYNSCDEMAIVYSTVFGGILCHSHLFNLIFHYHLPKGPLLDIVFLLAPVFPLSDVLYICLCTQ